MTTETLKSVAGFLFEVSRFLSPEDALQYRRVGIFLLDIIEALKENPNILADLKKERGE